MFYCNKCAEKYEYSETMSKSIGKCECCGEEAECNDRPSRLLPIPKKQSNDKKNGRISKNL